MRFNLKYFIATFIIFAVEVLIATVFKNIYFLRAFIGDVLVVALIYTFILTFFDVKNRNWLILGIFIFSVMVEILQYFQIAEKLGFKRGCVGSIIIGNSFSWLDIVCYGAGCLIIYLQNKFCSNSNQQRNV